MALCEKRNYMETPLNQFEALSSKEKLPFMKEAMPSIAEILAKDSPKMMAEMMPMSQQIIEVIQYRHAGHDARKES